MNNIRFTLLGAVRAYNGFREIELGSPQQRSVLAVLLLGNGPVSVDQVVERIWGRAAPKNAKGAVRTYVSRLKQALELGSPRRPVISRSAAGYLCRTGPGSLDTEDFVAHVTAGRGAVREGRLEAAATEFGTALSLYRGTALAETTGWYLDEHRHYFEQLRCLAVEERAFIDIKLGNWVDALIVLPHEITKHPLNERLRELYALALYCGGRQAEALSVYHDIRTLLRTELGLDPSPRLQEIYQRILASDPTLIPAAPVASAAGGDGTFPRDRLPGAPLACRLSQIDVRPGSRRPADLH